MTYGIHYYLCKESASDSRHIWATPFADKISSAWKSDVTSIHTAYQFFLTKKRKLRPHLRGCVATQGYSDRVRLHVLQCYRLRPSFEALYKPALG